MRAQPGVVGTHLNNALKPYGRRIGPDPASIDAAMLGGILSNNSSGMCCGVSENAYHMIHSMTVVLPNGLMLLAPSALFIVALLIWLLRTLKPELQEKD